MTGVAWEEDEPKIANVENLERRGRTQRLYCEIPRRERFGLGWREFQRSRHYRAILAVPLRADGKVRGCLSVDVQVDGHAEKHPRGIQATGTRAVLTAPLGQSEYGVLEGMEGLAFQAKEIQEQERRERGEEPSPW